MRKRTEKSAVFFLLAAAVAMLAGCRPESPLQFSCGAYPELPLVALNPGARKSVISNPSSSPYAYFALSEEQLSFVKASASVWGPVSFRASLSALPDGEGGGVRPGQVAFGLLFEDDFDGRGRLKKDLAERPLARASLDASRPAVALALAAGRDDAASVRGFLVHSTVPLSVDSAAMIPVCLGFDASGKVPAFFFGTDGGTAAHAGTDGAYFHAADFSGAEDLLGPPGRRDGKRAVMSLGLAPLASQPESPAVQPRVELDVGGEAVFVRRTSGQERVTLHCAALKNPYAQVRPVRLGEQVTAVVMRLSDCPLRADGAVVEPLATDPGMIPLWEREAWRARDYELFEWEQFPGILFIDTADYAVQDDFFKRLAFFTEKTGYVGTLVPDSVLKGQHGFNAHDYRAETLADFFTLALTSGFPLNSRELLLRDILAHNGVIVPVESGGSVAAFAPGYGGVISISQQSALYLRHTFIVHEGLHGLYFVDEPFRAFVSRVFSETDADTKGFLLRYFQVQSSLGYNLDDTYLIQNEFMAYVMQQPVSRTGAYFAENLAWRGSMLREEPGLSAYVRETKGQGFTEASRRLSEYVFSRWGMESGRVSLVTR